jgi:hypothetical protein
MQIEQLAKEVMNLSLEKRAELAQRLLASLDEAPLSEIERLKDKGGKGLHFSQQKGKNRKNSRVDIFIKQDLGIAHTDVGQYGQLCLKKSLFFKVKRTTSPGQLKRTGTPDVPTPELV